MTRLATSAKRKSSGRESRGSERSNERRVGFNRKTNRANDDSSILSFELDVFRRVCENINSPRALTCWLLASNGEWPQYLELTFPDPSLDGFADDYLVTEMMSKNPRLDLGINRASVAIQKFLDSELKCADTNRAFRAYFNEPSSHYRELHLISRVQSILSNALGPLSRHKLETLDQTFRFGPGSTSSVRGKDVLMSRKYTSTRDVTPRLRPYISAITGLMNGDINVVSSSRVTTVPKNAKTDRTICIEPHGNIYFQLGVGQLLRSTLTRLGLRPNDQERNRQLARTSVRDGYATIDLSMASDTISLEVVSALLPDDWFHLLWLGRTDHTVLPTGELITLEKFSSMGNGFTWELESLIFWAIARNLTDKDIGVFGDDLIVPIDIVPKLKEHLEFFGFKMNERKSFWQGDFRESCGEDWWRDVNVRPLFLRKDSRDIWSLPHYAVQVANAIRIYSHHRGDRVFCDNRFLPAWLYAKRRSGEYNTTYTSYGYGDDGLVKNFDEASPSKLRHGFQGYRGVVARRRSFLSRRTCELGAYLAALDRGSPGLVSRSVETDRGRLGRPRTEVVPVFDWYNLGPWL